LIADPRGVDNREACSHRPIDDLSQGGVSAMKGTDLQSADTPAEPASSEDAPVAVPRLKQGDTIGSRFVIDERLRVDVLGTVYRAVDEKSGKNIAILVLAPEMAGDRAATDRLRLAVKQATGLTHKNIVSTFGMGKEAKRRYFAREYVDGQTLAELLEKKARAGKHFTLKGAYNLVAHICNALDYAAEHMSHQALRPSAVLINRTGRVKVADFGLAELRSALEGARASLGRWDQACLPVGGDDITSIGVILFSLLAGRPPAADERSLPEALLERLAPEINAVVLRCLDTEHAERFAQPAEVKAALQSAVQLSQADDGPVVAGARPRASASLEILDASQVDRLAGPLPGEAPKASRRKTDGGFVIPELGTPGKVDDDGTVQRWLIQRDGTDFGPFTRKQVVAQLFNEEITAQAILYDIETDQRMSLAEFNVFDEAYRAWIHEKAEREKRRAEEAIAAVTRRRNRILIGVVATVMLTVGGTAGGWLWYKSTLPEPVRANLPSMVSRFEVALPSVSLPEELPETEAEIRERRQRVVADRVATRARKNARQIAREAKLAASSELDAAEGTGAKFNRPKFHQIIGQRNGRLMKCLTDEVRRNPALKSTKVHITIIPRGDLINVKLEGGSSRGTGCVRAAFSGLKVPAFDGTNVKVKLPFNFE
jgi:serine/threonine protein kinase